MSLQLREARIEDSKLIVTYIHELATYEKLSHECKAEISSIEEWLFGKTPRAACILAEWNGYAAGFALYYYTFSTFLAKPGIYIEDVFVRPAYRRKGIATQMFQYFAKKAVEEGFGRIEWWVLDWNQDAITFYHSLGAEPMDEWTVQRISGNALLRLAGNV